jgi:hypothetical protein
LQSPAISNRLGLLGSVLNRQAARWIHFISFVWFVLFGAHGPGLVGGLAPDNPARSSGAKGGTVHGRLDQRIVRVVGAHGSADRKGYLAVLLAEWHTAELCRI